LINLWENGFAERLSDGIVRARFHNGMSKQELAQPGAVYGYHIDAWNTCEMFKAGDRIRLESSSSAFPKYSRNLNTGEALGKNSDMITAEQTIYHDAQHLSRVTLPVIR
jgi:predicted acyl esterase